MFFTVISSLFCCMVAKLTQTSTDEKHSVTSNDMSSNKKENEKKETFGLNIDTLLSFTTIFTTKQLAGPPMTTGLKEPRAKGDKTHKHTSCSTKWSVAKCCVTQTLHRAQNNTNGGGLSKREHDRDEKESTLLLLQMKLIHRRRGEQNVSLQSHILEECCWSGDLQS